MKKPRAERDATLSRVEIDTLLNSIKPKSLPTFDITAPHPLRPDEIPRVQKMIEPFLRHIESVLAPLLQGTVAIRIDSIDRRRASDVVASLPAPGAALYLDPAGLVHVDSALAFPMVERLLGGEPSGTPPRRELRDLEWRLLTPCFERLAAPLGRVASNAFLPNEPLVVIRATAEFLDRRAALQIALPGFRITAPDPERVDLAVRLSGNLALADYRRLAVGDILVTDHPAGTVVAGALEGRLGGSRERKAFQVVGPSDGRRGRIRRRGPARDSGIPDPSIEIRAVVSERGLSRGEIDSLQAGSILRFPASAGISLRVNSKTIAASRPIAAGKRRAVEVEGA